MEHQRCLIPDCSGDVYSPAGTGYVCKEHFLDYLRWRRRKGPAMFSKYAAMTMEERDSVASEWKKTVQLDR